MSIDSRQIRNRRELITAGTAADEFVDMLFREFDYKVGINKDSASKNASDISNLQDDTDPPLKLKQNGLSAVKQVTQIKCLADIYESLDGTYFKLYDDGGSVGVWIDVDNSGTAAPAGALACTRQIEITTIVKNMTATQVATAIYTALVADSKFEAGADDLNGVFRVQHTPAGALTDSVDGDTEFLVETYTSGVTSTLDRVVAIEGIRKSRTDGTNDTIQPINDIIPTFASGTVTLPAASGGNIVPSSGSNLALTIANDKFKKLVISVDENGDILLVLGADQATKVAAYDEAVASAGGRALGEYIISTVGAVVQNVENTDIYQYAGGGGAGGSGVSGFSIYGTVSGDSDATGTFTDSLVNAVFASDAVTNISGKKSFKVTMAGTDSGTLYSKSVEVKERSNDKLNAQKFVYSYDGDSGDWSAKMQYSLDDSTWYDIDESELLLEANTDVVTATLQGYMPSESAALYTRWALTVEVSNSGKILRFNDIEFTDDPLTAFNILADQSFVAGASNLTGTGTSPDVQVQFDVSSPDIETGSGLFTVISTNPGGAGYTQITALKKCSITVNAQVASNAANDFAWIEKNEDGTKIGVINQSHTGGVPISASATIDLDATDYLIVHAYNIAAGTFRLNVSAIGESSAIVHSGSGTENDAAAMILNNGTASVDTQDIDFLDPSTPVNRTAAGDVDILWKPNYYTVPPLVTPSLHAGNANGNITVVPGSVTTSGCTIRTTNGAVLTDYDFGIEVRNQGIDYKNPNAYAVTPITQTCYLKEHITAGTDAGTFTAGAWVARKVNTLSGDTGWCTVTNGTTGTDGTADQFTLAAGKYLIESESPAYRVNNHRSKLVQDPDGTPIDIATSKTATVGAGIGVTTEALLRTTVEISSAQTFELQHRCQTTFVAAGKGLGASIDGEDEIYNQITITKLL